MNLIVAVDENWAIGNRNKLLVSIPADMKFFREMTKGNVVVMGRKTMESFPGGQPLKKRTNIVLSRDESYQVKDAVVVHSLEELLEQLKSFPEESIYVIGGESIYRMLLPYCREADSPRIRHSSAADTYFPDLDADPEWELEDESEEQTYFDLEYVFTRYRRKQAEKKLDN